MRDIKFRAWENTHKFMSHKISVGNVVEQGHNYTDHAMWVEASQVPYETHSQWMHFDEHSNVILMQYTGLKDKNGKEIYEGDIVKTNFMAGSNQRHIGKVEYQYAGYYVVGVGQHYGIREGLHTVYEVIGNVFENPELLEGN